MFFISLRHDYVFRLLPRCLFLLKTSWAIQTQELLMGRMFLTPQPINGNLLTLSFNFAMFACCLFLWNVITKILRNVCRNYDIYPQRYNVTQFIYLFLENALRVSGGISAHHQEYNTVSTAPGTCQTVTATCRYRGEGGTPTPPRKRQVAVTVWQVPDAVDAVLCSWWWLEMPPERRRAVSRNK